MTTTKLAAAFLPVLALLGAGCGSGGGGNPEERDCEGVAGGAATVDQCGTCDDDPTNDCEQDCAGTWGGTATVDACGTCDTDPKNDCWLHGSHGTMTVPDSTYPIVSSGTLFISRGGTALWYFYTSETSPPVTIGNLSAHSTCASHYQGVTGVSSLGQLTDVSALSYGVASTGAALVGTRRQNVCYQGLIVFKQADQYGVIDFLDEVGDQLLLEYWIGAPGVIDFSDAPPATG